MSTVGMLITGALGMLGWFFAWHGQRAVVGKDKEVADAKAGEASARQVALEAEAKAATAQALLAAAQSRAGSLQVQLDAERKSRHDLVDELAKRGVPVGDVVVDAAVDRLYPNGDQGGQGSSASAGGDSQRVPGQPADHSGGSSGKS